MTKAELIAQVAVEAQVTGEKEGWILPLAREPSIIMEMEVKLWQRMGRVNYLITNNVEKVIKQKWST